MEVVVKKADLLKALRANRAQHKSDYEAAVLAYQDKVVQTLEERLAAAKRGEKVPHSLDLPIPEQHVADFDRIIRMMEMHVGDTFELEEYQFSQYVQNEWEWRRSFLANTTSYLAK